MGEDFYLAAVPEPRTILGLRLRPFSLGHVLLLHRVKSAFLVPSEGAPSYSDLAISVLICAQTYEENLATFNDPTLPDFMRKWHDRITGADSIWCRLGLRNVSHIDLSQKCAEFADYIRAGSKVPDYDFNPGDFQEMACPSVEIIKVTLMRDMHFSEREIMDRPWALCLWDHVVLRALDNQVRMFGAEAKEDALEAARLLAKNIEEGKFKPCQS